LLGLAHVDFVFRRFGCHVAIGGVRLIDICRLGRTTIMLR
jgi:hypothetical protein